MHVKVVVDCVCACRCVFFVCDVFASCSFVCLCGAFLVACLYVMLVVVVVCVLVVVICLCRVC